MKTNKITDISSKTNDNSVGIIPSNLSKKDLAFVYMLTKEMVVARLSEKYIFDMKAKDKELSLLNKKIQKRVYFEPKYATTKNAAAYIGVDPSFLTKRQGTVFIQNEHFYKPEGGSIIRWNVEELEKWLTSHTEKQSSISQELASLLERS